MGTRSARSGGRARRLSGDADAGAALVEFALVLPVLVLFLFGIIDFGYAYSQSLNLRHGSREGSRLVAVNYNPNGQSGQAQADTIGAAICSRMDLASGATIQLAVDGTTYPTDATSPGRFATVTITSPVRQLTGLFKPILGSITLRTSVESRIEQRVTWTSAATSFAPPSPYTC